MPRHTDRRKKDKRPRRNVMKDFRIDEISAVDSPAQAGATVTMFKRDDGMEKRFGVLGSVEGHQHLMDVMGPNGSNQTGFTTFNNGHSHEWVRRGDGTIVILASTPSLQELFADPEAPPPLWLVPLGVMFAGVGLKILLSETPPPSPRPTSSGNS